MLNSFTDNSLLPCGNFLISDADALEWDTFNTYCNLFSVDSMYELIGNAENYGTDSSARIQQDQSSQLLISASHSWPPLQQGRTDSPYEAVQHFVRSSPFHASLRPQTASPSSETSSTSQSPSCDSYIHASSVSQYDVSESENTMVVEFTDVAQQRKLRRKQQNRQAQQKYRERGWKRTKMLEEKIVALEAEVDILKAENARLREL